MIKDDPKAELKKWQQERRSYPGWLVAPSPNRGRLSLATAQSLHIGSLAHGLFWDKLSDWSLEDRLGAWAELNWRMERALLPLPPEAVGIIEKILGEIAPFPSLAVDSPFFTTTAKTFANRTDLRWAWSSLAIGVLRHHREFRNAEQFDAWCARLSPLDADWDEIHHQRAYQQALWHVTFMADDRALEVLDTWQAGRGTDPYWQARKAGLLAELGRMDEAGHLWDECLRRLQGIRGGDAPFFASTRESAILSVAWMRETAYTENPKTQRRIRALSERDGCIYWNELSELSKPDLDYREKHERSKEKASSLFFSNSIWKPEAAVQCLRLSEELGEPLETGDGGIRRTSAVAQALKEVLDDLGHADEKLAATLLMRLRDEGFWEKRFTPAQIARFPDALVADLQRASDSAWHQLDATNTQGDVERPALLLSGVLRLLRHRLSSKAIETTFIRLLKLGNMPAVQADHLVAGALKKAIEEFGEAIGGTEVAAVLPNALLFPLPSEVGKDRHFWPEPFAFRYPSADCEAEISGVASRIEELIQRAPNDREALWRLSYLHECGLLPETASRELAARLWGESDTLPDVSPYCLSILLGAPPTEPGKTERILANHFLTTPPRSLRSSDGSVSFGRSTWFRGVTNVSKPYRGLRRARYVHWTATEAATLFRFTENWWTSEGKELVQKHKDHWLGSGPRDFMYWVIRSLARAIAPNLSPGSDIGKQRLPLLLTEIEGCGFPILSALPMLMRFKVATQASVSERLIDGLRSTNRDTVTDALWGIIHWCEFQEEAKLPAVPHRLVEQLLIYLAARADGQNAANTVGTLEAILAHNRTTFSNRAKELLGLALDALQGRAAYPDDWYQRDGMRHVNTADLRRNAVLLAAAAHKAGISDDESVAYWLEVGQSDPLTAVREAITE